MSASAAELESRLLADPSDWEVRLQLIEKTLADGDRAKAQRYVRDSPNDGPVPHSVQTRLFALMTQPSTESVEPAEPVKEPEQKAEAPASADQPYATKSKLPPVFGEE
ncbi:MAG: hypothetical protein AAF226_19530 [Verrucomicrobiota bacterium]